MTPKVLALVGLGILVPLLRPLSADDLSQILPGVFRSRDTCNFYPIVRNQKALLIDFESGKILKSFPEINARQVKWILHALCLAAFQSAKEVHSRREWLA